MSTPENKAEENVTTENETTGLADAIKESRMVCGSGHRAQGH